MNDFRKEIARELTFHVICTVGVHFSTDWTACG